MPETQLFVDRFGNQIVLTETVRTTILQKHPEVAGFIDEISKVLEDPDVVRLSVRDQRAVLYYRYVSEVLGGKWVVVVVKQIDRNYISTIYATDQVKVGDMLWIKPNTP